VLYKWLHPEWVDFRRGESDIVNGAYEEASLHYRRAITRGTREPCVFLRCAKAQLLDGNSSGADETASDYLRQAAWLPDDAYEMAELFVSNGRLDTALQILKKIVEKNSRHRRARFRLAQVLTWTRDFDSAINHYHLLLEE